MDVTARVDAEIALVESKKLISEANARLLQLSVTDFLTGLKNRRAFDEGLEIAMSHTLRSAKAFTVVLMDVDQFKSINNEYGHAAGDEVLREFARLMERSLRLEDLAARYGGDEFVILLEENSSDALTWSHRTAYFLGWRPNTSRKPPGTISRLGGSRTPRTALRVKTAQLRRLYGQQSMGDGAGRRICIGLHEAND